jgi:hypothetical protein
LEANRPPTAVFAVERKLSAVQQPNERKFHMIDVISAIRTATEAALDMARTVEGLTPDEIAEMGWPGMTAAQLVESEWRCWFEEEMSAMSRDDDEPEQRD